MQKKKVRPSTYECLHGKIQLKITKKNLFTNIYDSNEFAPVADIPADRKLRRKKKNAI